MQHVLSKTVKRRFGHSTFGWRIVAGQSTIRSFARGGTTRDWSAVARCGRWIHFTIRAKWAESDDEAEQFPKLPDNLHVGATIR
jgi:hypothetical protein